MRSCLTLCFLLFLSGFAMGQKVAIKKTLLFATSQSQLTAAHKQELELLLDALRSLDTYTITISGHTDGDGNAAYNQDLSAQRANAVKEYFLQAQIPESSISVQSFGATQPISANNTEQGKQKNRRVDILIEGQATPANQDSLIEEETTIWQLYQQTKIVPQEFKIQGSKDTVLRCEQGTIIYIKANSLRRSGLTATNGPFTIQVKEAFLKSDMILENLSTTSNGQIIETQGMVYVNAEQDGEPVSVVPGKDMVIMIPTDTIIPNARIFDGERNSHDSIMNWTVNNNSLLSSFSLPQLEYCEDLLCGGAVDIKCPFFFCEIRKFFRRLIGSPKITRLEPPDYLRTSNLDSCQFLADLFREYGVRDLRSLIDAVNQPLYERYNVNSFKELAAVIEEEKLKAIKLSYQNKKIAFEDFRYYVYNRSRLGWSNVDVFVDLNDSQLTTLKVNLKHDESSDVKLVFKNRDFVLPPTNWNGLYTFKGVPKGEEVWIVAVKYDKGVPYLSMEEVAIKEKTYEPRFVQLTLPQLEKELKKLDRD